MFRQVHTTHTIFMRTKSIVDSIFHFPKNQCPILIDHFLVDFFTYISNSKVCNEDKVISIWWNLYFYFVAQTVRLGIFGEWMEYNIS